MASANNTSDFNQWLHAMKMVARLPGGMPPEFRRKLWLALAERHLQTNSINWEKEETRCLSEPSNRDDDEELEVQIVKDLHRTGSSLFSGPAGSVNQAKLKRILVGYARWNPSVGYCQGFNMLGALILQVMDKNEIESLKVMIFLIEGILPPGYFSGSLSGLQTDMAVFRDIMAVRLPKLAKHLQKLQGPIGEASFEPPLTNVFTMQWFLTLFCTCLPYNCVLRVWDLVLIEGSDILLRTALAIWGLLEKRILQNKTADEFYCNMGMLSGELLNGHLFDSNGLIQKVVELGPIPELQKMRDKHIYNITPWKDKRGLRLFFSDDEGDSDDDSRAALTNAWGIRLGGTGSRRGSLGLGNLTNTSTSNSGGGSNGPNITALSSSTISGRPVSMHENRERIALDITLLKKQYDKLRERQRQAHIILTTTARQGVDSATNSTMPVNQYLLGKNAIVNKGRRIGPPAGAIPPVRKPTMKVSPKQHKKVVVSGSSGSKSGVSSNSSSFSLSGTTTKLPKTTTVVTIPAAKDLTSIDKATSSGISKNSTLHKSPSVTSTNSSLSDSSMPTVTSHSRKKSESSSYSEDSDENSSTSTSLCDDDNVEFSVSSIEASPLKKTFTPVDFTPSELQTTSQLDECLYKLRELNVVDSVNVGNGVANASDFSNIKEASGNADENNKKKCPPIVDEQSTAVPIIENDLENDKFKLKIVNNQNTSRIDDNDNLFTIVNIEPDILSSSTSKDAAVNSIKTVDDEIQSASITTIITTTTITSTPSTDIQKPSELIKTKFQLSPIAITSTSQLSPIADISKYLSNSSISPLRTPSSFLEYANDDNIGDNYDDDDCSENGNDGNNIREDHSAIIATPTLNKIIDHSPSASIIPSSSSLLSSSATFKDKSNFQVNEDGVTNEYFERLNAPERPCRLELQHIVLIQQQIGTEEFIISNPVCSTFEQTTKEYSIITEPLDSTLCDIMNEDAPKTAVPDKFVETSASIGSGVISDDTLNKLDLSSLSPLVIKKETSTLDSEWNNFHVSDDNDDSSEHFYDKYYVNDNPAIDDSIGNSPIPTKSSIHSPWSLASISENQLLITDNVPLIITTASNSIDNSESPSGLLIKNDDDLVIATSSPPPPITSPASLPTILFSEQNKNIINNDETDEKKLMLPTDFNSQKRHSNRALQIIEENSLILDKILKKTLTGNKEIQPDPLSAPTNLSNDYNELAIVCTGKTVENFKDCMFVDKDKSGDDDYENADDDDQHHIAKDDEDDDHHNKVHIGNDDEDDDDDDGNYDKFNNDNDNFPIPIHEPSLSPSPQILADVLPSLTSPVTPTQTSSISLENDLNSKDSITFSLRSIKCQMNSLIDDDPCCANNSLSSISPTKIELFLNEPNHGSTNSDITKTLKSIKNTIKSVDNACVNPNQRKSTFNDGDDVDITTGTEPSESSSGNKTDINKLLQSLNNSIKSVDDKKNAKLIELPINLDDDNLTDNNDISQTLNSIKNTIKCVDDACVHNNNTTTTSITKIIITPNQDEVDDIQNTENILNNDDISETLQSIQNTIKSVDNACVEKTSNNDGQVTSLTSSFIGLSNQDDLLEYQSGTTSGSTTLSTIEDTTSILEYKSYKTSSSGSVLFKDSIDATKTCSNDINETIYSIKNTIKSIDTLCEKEKKKFNSSRHHHHSRRSHHHNSSSSSSERNQFQFDSGEYNKSSSSSLSSSAKFNSSSGAKDLKYLEFQRNSRDIRREISPRRYRDDDRAEYESRATSLLSSSTSRLNNFHFDGGGSTKPQYIRSLPPNPMSVIKKPNGIGDSDVSGNVISRFNTEDSSIQMYKSHDSNLNIIAKDTAGSRFVKFQPTDKFSIRHTTVTSTFYDRFLSQKMERNVRMDKSPVKITQNYFDSLRLLTPTHHHSYDRDRPKSAENSPSRSNFDLLSNNDDMLQTATTTTMSVSMSACSKKIIDHHGGGANGTGNNIDKLQPAKIVAVSTDANMMAISTPTSTTTTICGGSGTNNTDTNIVTAANITDLPTKRIDDQPSTLKSNS